MRIDWETLALQTINVLVLVWLLSHFLYRPVMDMIARRRKEAERLLAEAAASRDRALAEESDVKKKHEALVAEGDRIRSEARSDAETARTELLRQAAAAAALIQSEARASLARECEARRGALEREAGELSISIARRLLDHLPAATATASLLEELMQEIAAFPPDARRRMAGPGEALELVTAVDIGAAAQERFRQCVAAALGTAPEISFRSDPILIAGVELHGPHSLLRHSWKADLERIAQDLIRDDHDAADQQQLA